MKATEDERMLFLLAGHFSNDISLLQKQFLFALTPAARGEIVQRPGTALAMLMVRLLVSRLVAAWELLKKAKYQELMEAALADLSASDGVDDVVRDAQAAAVVLHRELIDGGVLSVIRRKAAAHQDRRLMADALNRLPDDYEFLDFLAPHAGNTIYCSCDDVATAVLLDVTNQSDRTAAIEDLGDLLAKVSGAMVNYLQAYLAHFQLKYVGEDVIHEALEGGEFVDAPSIKSVRIPFFTSPDE